MLNSFAGLGTAETTRRHPRSKIQQAAGCARRTQGACVVMDPDTGAILAMASAPVYAADFAAVIEQANEPDDSTLVDRAAGSLYHRAPRSRSSRWPPRSRTTWPTGHGVLLARTMEIGNATVSNFNKANGSLTWPKQPSFRRTRCSAS
ncbi:MAG: hypothetical protein ACLT98_14555 [Eggerthellaceae bacterium]